MLDGLTNYLKLIGSYFFIESKETSITKTNIRSILQKVNIYSWGQFNGQDQLYGYGFVTHQWICITRNFRPRETRQKLSIFWIFVRYRTTWIWHINKHALWINIISICNGLCFYIRNHSPTPSLSSNISFYHFK